jgi:hypothetical protein
VLVDLDAIRQFLPEYNEIAQLGDARAAELTQKESVKLMQTLYQRALAQRLNITYDATLANAENGLRLLKGLKKAGYSMHLLGLTIDPHEALVRAFTRAHGERRYVPTRVILQAPKGFIAALPA